MKILVISPLDHDEFMDTLLTTKSRVVLAQNLFQFLILDLGQSEVTKADNHLFLIWNLGRRTLIRDC
jgi:hypothetical protein